MRILFGALFVCATAISAEAQIHTWRDASGNLVLSNRPQATAAMPAPTYAVPGAALIRTTVKPAASRGITAYDDLIRQHSERHGISADLVRAVIQQESGFNPRAISPKGAMGLMQLMPATARDLGVSDPFSPGENIRGGVRYLAQLLERFKQNVQFALAAYNAGPARVERYAGVPPFLETQNYVRRITGATQAPVPPPAPPPTIYKWMELVNGQPRLRFSNVAPKDVPFDVVGKK